MGPLQQLEAKLDELLDKKAPVKIPLEGRRTLAHALWVLALIFGVIQLYWAITWWQWGHRADEILNSLSYYTGGRYVHHLGMFYYLSLLAVAVIAVMLLIATPSLKAMKKSGWDILYYAAIAQAVLALLRLFASGGGFGDCIGSAVGAVVGAYLLFQVRDCFIMSHPADHHAGDHTAGSGGKHGVASAEADTPSDSGDDSGDSKDDDGDDKTAEADKNTPVA
jgi:hypothetical protein